MTVNHSERAHSIYSPSAFKRWQLCPASAQLTKDIESPDTEASLRGTWMHEQAEILLLGGEITDTESRFHTPSNVADIHDAVERVKEYIDSLSFFGKPDVILEQRVDMSANGHYDVYGTADVVIISRENNLVAVLDYKFGNTLVSPCKNDQLNIYMIGTINKLYSIDMEFPEDLTLVTGIIQPKAPETFNICSFTLQDLKAWYTETFVPAIKAAKSKNPKIVPGEEQCLFCPLRGKCETQTQAAMDIFDSYEDPASIETDDFAEVLDKLPIFETWLKGVKARALHDLEQGQRIRGYKLVRSAGRSKWEDEAKAEKWLAARKIPKEVRTKTTCVGISDARKLVKDQLKDNPRLQKAFEKLITKSEGKLTFAKSDDKREEVILNNPLTDGDII